MKKKYSFTIEEDLMDKFRELTKKDCVNMSAYVESKIKEYIERRNLNEKSK